MVDPIARRLDALDRRIDVLNERFSVQGKSIDLLGKQLGHTERSLDRFTEVFQKHVRHNKRFTDETHELLIALGEELHSAIERLQLLEHRVFPGVTTDKARLRDILGSRSTPTANPLDRRKPGKDRKGD
jgi:uncharacterized coiled-coil protein SlyX